MSDLLSLARVELESEQQRSKYNGKFMQKKGASGVESPYWQSSNFFQSKEGLAQHKMPVKNRSETGK